MPTPITWRNVQINDGSNSAALGNTAANFGRSAVQGLSVLNDQFDTRINREDERLTNEAISAALSGGPQVSDNRRVDANALQLSVERDALGNRQEQMHGLDVRSKDLGNQRDQFIVENQEAQQVLNDKARELGMDADQSDIDLNKYKTSVAKWQFGQDKAAAKLDATQRAHVQALDSHESVLENQYFEEIAQQSGVANPTQDQINQARQEARARVQGPEGRQALRRELTRIGGSEEAFKASAAGRRDGLAEVAATNLQEAAQERRQIRIENEGEEAVFRGEGNYSKTINVGGVLQAGTDTEIEAQKLGNAKTALGRLNTQGVNTASLSDDDKELIEQVRAIFPNSSMFIPVVKGYVDDRGNLDQTKLRLALKQGSRDILLAQADIDQPVGGGVEAESGGGTQAPADSTQALVDRFKAVQDRVSAAGDLPRNVQEMVMKAFEGKVSKGGKSVLDEGVRLRNLNEVEQYLDNKEARESSAERAAQEDKAREERLKALNKSLNG